MWVELYGQVGDEEIHSVVNFPLIYRHNISCQADTTLPEHTNSRPHFQSRPYLTSDPFYPKSSSFIPYSQCCLTNTDSSVACLSIPTAMAMAALLFEQPMMNLRLSIFPMMTQMMTTIQEPGHKLRLIALNQSWSKIVFKKSSAACHTH